MKGSLLGDWVLVLEQEEKEGDRLITQGCEETFEAIEMSVICFLDCGDGFSAMTWHDKTDPVYILIRTVYYTLVIPQKACKIFNYMYFLNVLGRKLNATWKSEPEIKKLTVDRRYNFLFNLC